jgi:hypothetical protein
MRVATPACWLVDCCVCDHDFLVLCASPDGTFGAANMCCEFSLGELLFTIKCYIMLKSYVVCQRSLRHVFPNSFIHSK